MTTFILGANGRLGGVLCRHAARSGLKWKGQARDGKAEIPWSGQLSDPAAQGIFQQGATLINMIGVTSNDPHQLQLVNVKFVQDILTRASDAGIAHVILASSAAVYGIGSDAPLTEDAPLAPLTAYGASKARMEDAVHAAAANAHMPAITILRIGNVAGSDALLSAAENKVRENTPMQLHRFADGSAPVRSYIGPKDLFRVVRALSAPYVGSLLTLNVAAPSPVSLDAAIDAYQSHLLPDLEWNDAPVPNGIPHRVVLSTNALEKHVKLDWKTDYASEMSRQVAQDRSQ